MKILRQALKNISSLLVANFAEKLFLYILFVLMAREMGPDSYGRFFLAFTFCNIIFIFNELGLSATVIRHISCERKLVGHYFGNFMGIRILSSLFCCLFLLIATNLSEYSTEVKNLIYILVPYFVLSYLSHPFTSVMRAYEKMHFVALVTIIDRGITTLLGVILIMMKADLLYVALVFGAGSLFRIILSWLIVRKNLIERIFLVFNFRLWRDLLSESFPIALFMVFTLLSFRTDTLILSYYNFNDSVIGHFNAAHVLFAVMILPATAFVQGLFPYFARILSEPTPETFRNVLFSYVGILSLSLTPALIGYLLSSMFVSLIFGPEYTESEEILRFFAMAVPFYSINILTQWLLISVNQSKWSLYLIIMLAGLNIFLNFFLLPIYGALGGGIATLVSNLILACVSCFSLFFHRKTLFAKLINQTKSSKFSSAPDLINPKNFSFSFSSKSENMI